MPSKLSTAAAALSKARWAKTTAEQRKAVGEALAEARKAIPATRRVEIARTAALARWQKKKGRSTKKP